MNLTELYHLGNWASDNILNKGIPSLYQQLAALLSQNSQPHQPKQPFADQRDNLLTALKEIPTDELSIEQLNFLKALGLGNYIGEDGKKLVEDILFKNSIDVAAAFQQINEITAKLNNALQKLIQLRDGLSGLLPEQEIHDPGKIHMRIRFAGDAHLSNVVDFKKWGEAWYEIGRGIAMANDSAPEDIQIVGASNGSIILELMVAAKIAGIISGILLAALHVAEKYYQVKIMQENARTQTLSNDLLQALVREAENIRTQGIANINAQAREKLGIPETGSGDKINALNKSIRKLTDFILKGGTVDISKPDFSDDAENNDTPKEMIENIARIRSDFQEIRRIQKGIPLLDFAITDDPPHEADGTEAPSSVSKSTESRSDESLKA